MDIDAYFNMPPPAPRAPRASGSSATRKRPQNEKLDFDEQSDSESMGEYSLRHAGAPAPPRSHGHASGSGSRRRRRRSQSGSRSSHPLQAPTPPPPAPTTVPMANDDAPSASLNMDLGPGAGVFRDRISSEDADPAERSAPGVTPSAGRADDALHSGSGDGDAAIARAAMARAGVPRDDIIGIVDQASASMSESKLKYAVPIHVLYDRGACPICEESATSVHREAQLRIAGTATGRPGTRTSQSHQEEVAQTIQARTALVKNELRKHELLFKTEAELRGRLPDKRIAVYVLRMRRRIEREMEDARIHYVRWTQQMLLDHFNVFNDHIRDNVRIAAYTHDLVLRQIPRIAQCMYVPSMTQPGTMLLDVRAAKAFDTMVNLEMKTEARLTALQNTVDPNAIATLRALTGIINSYTCDDSAAAVTCDPEASAGMGAQQQAALSANSGAAALGAMSGKSIYEINAL